MDLKIKVTFTDGKRRTLNAPGELKNIDHNRKARFVMDTMEVYGGYCDGDIDEGGDFCLMSDKLAGYGIAFPVSRLLGWCYETTGRKKKTQSTKIGLNDK